MNALIRRNDMKATYQAMVAANPKNSDPPRRAGISSRAPFRRKSSSSNRSGDGRRLLAAATVAHGSQRRGDTSDRTDERE
ncbi:unnamed protein product [Linum trigynum]|uniref:Uncharacterized protein n=1 Tax=Linum trigynum TaxID=586398 RepID=A0AAV2G7M1_9ROSI